MELKEKEEKEYNTMRLKEKLIGKLKHGLYRSAVRLLKFREWLEPDRDTGLSYVMRELKSAGAFNGDIYGDMLGKAVVEMYLMFSAQGHSGMSASSTNTMANKVLKFEPITPLTGEESEWCEPYTKRGDRQNNRCSHVFMDPSGQAYDSEGIVFVDEEGGPGWTNIDSRVPITFPYTPKVKYMTIKEFEDSKNV